MVHIISSIIIDNIKQHTFQIWCRLCLCISIVCGEKKYKAVHSWDVEAFIKEMFVFLFMSLLMWLRNAYLADFAQCQIIFQKDSLDFQNKAWICTTSTLLEIFYTQKGLPVWVVRFLPCKVNSFRRKIKIVGNTKIS